MAVGDEQTGVGPVLGIAQAKDDVVETALQGRQQVLARHAASSQGVLVEAAELALAGAVQPAGLLLCAQLPAEVRNAAAAELRVAAVVARGVTALLERAFRRETALPLHEELFAFPPAELAHGSCILGHVSLFPSFPPAPKLPGRAVP